MEEEKKIHRVWLTLEAVWVEYEDGEQRYELLSDYARLKNASTKELQEYTVTEDGIFWENIDESLGFEYFPKR